MTTDILLFYCTAPDAAAAEKIALHLVTRGLARCVNRVPGLTSYYQWDGELKTGTEELLLIKTAADNADELTRELANIHPYYLPEIIAVPVTNGHQPYIDWIRNGKH